MSFLANSDCFLGVFFAKSSVRQTIISIYLYIFNHFWQKYNLGCYFRKVTIFNYISFSFGLMNSQSKQAENKVHIKQMNVTDKNH